MKQFGSWRHFGRASIVLVALCCSTQWLCHSAYGQVIAASGVGPLAGNQSGLSFGMDFEVNQPISISALGFFDADQDGLVGAETSIQVEIWSRDNGNTLTNPADDSGIAVLVDQVFDTGNQGTLNPGGVFRFLDLSSPLVLPTGSYTVSALGFTPSDTANNRGFDIGGIPEVVLNDSGGAIEFAIPSARYGGSGAAGVWPATVDAGPAARYYAGSFIYEVPTIDPFLRLTIDRDTGQMSLSNTTGSAVQMLGYTITSPDENLDSDAWLSIADNYDADAPLPDGGTVDAVNNWTRLTQSGASTDLSEFEFDGGNGASLSVLQEIDFGAGAWQQSPNENVTFRYTIPGGDQLTGIVEFVGNGGEAFEFGDLNYDGTAFGLDDFTDVMLPNLVSDQSLLSVAGAYNAGDLDGDKDVDRDDFRIFKNNYVAAGGSASALAAAAVPEPSSAVLLLMMGGVMLTRRRRSFGCSLRNIVAS